MKNLITIIARKLWPDLDMLNEADRLALSGELFGALYGLPFVFLALGWLIAVTDWQLLSQNWPLLLLFLGLSFVAGRLTFFQFTVDKSGSFDYNGSSLEIVIVFSAMLILGPTAVWIPFIGRLINFAVDRPRTPSRYNIWNRVRNLIFNLGASILGLLLALALYARLGGQFPLPGLTLAETWPAFLTILIWLPWDGLFILSYAFLLTKFKLTPSSIFEDRVRRGKRMFLFFFVTNSPAFFGILAAALYNPRDLAAYLFLIGGVLLASLLARRLSQQALLSQQRSREVTYLEQLGRAIIAAPEDASTLPQLLEEYVPQMFGYYQLEIQLFSRRSLLQLPGDRSPVSESFWTWLQDNPELYYFAPGQTPPWEIRRTSHPLFITLIVSAERAEPIGGIYLALDHLYFKDTLTDLQPALQVLAAQIATTLRRAEVHIQNIAHQKTAQELAFAWQIQAGFLPHTLPQIDGWQLSAVLKPCKETSGDFYDVILFPNGHLGLLIADVADKGMGAALFMALSRTLIRTFAFEYQTRPDLVLQAANQRILTDTNNDMFVTVFFAVLDPETGIVTYANAGHNPPYLFQSAMADNTLDSPWPRELRNTGMPLGILPDAKWQAKTLNLAAGDALIFYTDGVTEAQNLQGTFFSEQRLVRAIQDNIDSPAQLIQDAILAAVDQFSAETAPCDDVTLVILKRE